jgi:myo-inositol-1(or 4)-monophosphatase
LPAVESSEFPGRLEAIMREAGEVAREATRTPLKHWTKGHDHSPVSEGDIAVNNFLRARLCALAPAAGWLSEETEDEQAARDVRMALATVWIVDPIDGTRAYIAGRDDWTVSVALVEDGRPVVAALYAPVTDEMFIATAGGGTTLNGRAVRASAGGDIAGAKLAGPKRYLQTLEGLCAGAVPQPRIHSLALRLTRVAEGALDLAFASPGSHDWDLAAADLLVHEAGGVMTDLTGQSLRYNQLNTVQGALIAAGPGRHASLVGLLRDRLAEFA